MNENLGSSLVCEVGLGSSKKQVLALFGEPHQKQLIEGTEQWSWLNEEAPDWVRFDADNVVGVNGEVICVDGIRMEREHSLEALRQNFPGLVLSLDMGIAKHFKVHGVEAELEIAMFKNGGNKYILRRVARTS